MMFFSAAGVLLVVCPLIAADMRGRKVDPTFLHRYIPDVPVKDADATTTCRYKPLFGSGDSQPGILRGVERFGEMTVLPGGSCKDVTEFVIPSEIHRAHTGGGPRGGYDT
jgi:hypothetical protein